MDGMDLREQLEQAIGHGPPLPAPEARLAEGRSAVRRQRTLVAVGAAAVAAAVVVPVMALGGAPTSAPRDLGPAASSSAQASDEPTVEVRDDPAPGPDLADDGTVPETDLETGAVLTIAELIGYPADVIIGPVVRDGERAFGLELVLEGDRSFALLRPTEDGDWRVHRLVTARPGEELATWLRGDGWLPTGEGS
jgi:hypothetical protein